MKKSKIQYIERRIFNYDNIKRIPQEWKGIYIFWHEKNCLYIGKTVYQTLQTRLTQHYENCHNYQLNMWIKAYKNKIEFCVARVPNKKISGLEKLLIKRRQPITNIEYKE